MNNGKKVEPTIIVIFGGTGDLAERKLVPAFYNLFLDNRMPGKFAIIGLGRTPLKHEDYRNRLKDGLNEFSRRGAPEDDQWEKFNQSVFYLQSNINDEASYQHLAEELACLDLQWDKRANRLFYLSVAPQFIETVALNLNKAGVARNPATDRIIVEKPFGYKRNQRLS